MPHCGVVRGSFGEARRFYRFLRQAPSCAAPSEIKLENLVGADDLGAVGRCCGHFAGQGATGRDLIRAQTLVGRELLERDEKDGGHAGCGFRVEYNHF